MWKLCDILWICRKERSRWWKGGKVELLVVGVGWIFGKLGAMDGLVRLHHRLAYSSPSSFVSSIRCRLTYFSVPLIIPCAPPNNSCKGFQLLKKADFQYKVSNITMWPGSSSFELTFEKLLPETNSLAICLPY